MGVGRRVGCVVVGRHRWWWWQVGVREQVGVGRKGEGGREELGNQSKCPNCRCVWGGVGNPTHCLPKGIHPMGKGVGEFTQSVG